VLRLLRQHEGPRDPIAWFYVVTRRVCNEMRLRTATRRDAEQAYGTSAGMQVQSGELLLEVKNVLRQLPARDQRLLELVLQGASSREIALLFDCNIRDVGQLVTRARRKARTIRDRRSRKRAPS